MIHEQADNEEFLKFIKEALDIAKDAQDLINAHLKMSARPSSKLALAAIHIMLVNYFTRVVRKKDFKFFFNEMVQELESNILRLYEYEGK